MSNKYDKILGEYREDDKTSLSSTYAKLDGSNQPFTGSITVGDGTDESIDWASGNITYVPIGGDIATYITNATAGDTLILAAGTYTTTDNTIVSKSLNIMGQGVGQTTVTTSTNAKDVFRITSDNVRISDMSITNAGAGTTVNGVKVDGTAGTVFSNVRLYNLNIVMSGAATATQYGIYYSDAGGEVRDITITNSNAVGNVRGLTHANSSTAETTTTLRAYNVNVITTGGTNSIGFYSLDNGASEDNYLYLYDCVGKVSGGSATNYALNVSGGDAFTYAYNCTFDGTGTSSADILASSTATTQLTNCVLTNGTTSGAVYRSGYALQGGTVKNVPLGESIANAITQATAGDTLILSAGTYTITATITVSKALNIVGQGVNQTIISCATDGLNIFNVTSDNVSIRNLSITASSTSGTTRGIFFNGTVDTIFSNCRVYNTNITVTCTGAGTTAGTGIQLTDAGGEIKDVYIVATGDAGTLSGIVMQNNSTAEANTTLNVYNVRAELTMSAGAAAYPFRNLDNVATLDSILNLYNCYGKATGATTSAALLSTGGDAITTAYNCYFSGATYDLSQSTSSSVTIYNCTLQNSLINGTILYDGEIRGEDLWLSDDLTLLSDTGVISLGAASDGTITHDGNSLNIIANAVTATDGLELTAGYFKITGGTDIRPSADSTTAINIAQADGTDFVTFDTTNKRVGIGTTSPSFKIDVNGTGRITTSLNVPWIQTGDSGSNKTILSMTSAGSKYGNIQVESVAGTGAWSLGYQDSAGTTIGTSVLTWNGSGNVGIGTTAPAQPLHVSGTNTNLGTFRNTGDNYEYFDVSNTQNNLYLGVEKSTGGSISVGSLAKAGVITTSQNNTALHFGPAQDVDMTILDSGNIGIGTTAPLRRLDINEATGNCLRLIYNDADGSAANYVDFLVGATGGLTITSSLNSFTFGNGVADTDTVLNFTGTTNSGVLTWMEDEDYFQFSDDIFLNTGEAVMFEATTTKLMYGNTGDLDVYTPSQKTLELQTSVYNDANVGGLVLRTGGTAPGVVQWLDNDGDNTGIYTIGFAVDEQGSGSIEIPHDYKEGTNLTFHIHYGLNDAPTGTDQIRFDLIYNVQRDGTTFVDATTIDSTDVAVDTQYKTGRIDFAAITGTTFKIGDQFNFTVKRTTAVGDAYAGEVLMQTLGFHYETDTLGSRQIGTK